MTEDTTLYCSFCCKSQHEVQKLIAGPTAFICEECVKLSAMIVTSEMEGGRAGAIYLSKEPPINSREMIKEIVRELRKEETGEGTPTRSAETTGSVPEGDGGPVGAADAPNTGSIS